MSALGALAGGIGLGLSVIALVLTAYADWHNVVLALWLSQLFAAIAWVCLK